MNCAQPNCSKQTSGKSRYCQAHKTEARQRWLAMITEQAEAKTARAAEFQEIWDKAVQAGNAAAENHTPRPMIVQQHSNMLDDKSPVKQSWLVNDGVCGFAWVVVRPGTSTFARWLVKQKLASKHYYGGVSVWASGFGQSYERKMKWAGAVASILKEHGIEAYSGGRLD